MTSFWARFGYRPTAKLLHRFNLHHTRPRVLPDGSIGHRCEWCGASRTEIPLWLTAKRMAAARGEDAAEGRSIAENDAMQAEWKS